MYSGDVFLVFERSSDRYVYAKARSLYLDPAILLNLGFDNIIGWSELGRGQVHTGGMFFVYSDHLGDRHLQNWSQVRTSGVIRSPVNPETSQFIGWVERRREITRLPGWATDAMIIGPRSLNCKQRSKLLPQLLSRDGWTDSEGQWHVHCAFGCGAVLTPETATIDRYPLPGCHGGKYSLDNTRLACGPCNHADAPTLRPRDWEPGDPVPITRKREHPRQRRGGYRRGRSARAG